MVFKAIVAATLLAAGAYSILNTLSSPTVKFKKTKKKSNKQDKERKQTRKKNNIRASLSTSAEVMGTSSSSPKGSTPRRPMSNEHKYSHVSDAASVSREEPYWEFKLSEGEWRRMASPIIQELEKAFDAGQPMVQLSFENPRVRSYNSYVFDLSCMAQINLDTNYRREIRRVAPPARRVKRKIMESDDTDRRHWVTKSKRSRKSESFLHEVAVDSLEYRNIAGLFNRSRPQNARGVLNILRVENKYLHDRYVLAKKSIKSKHGYLWDESSMVRKLFHGTKQSAIPSIIQGVDAGFKPLLSGSRTGDIYGKGSYFSSLASYSDAYTENLNGIKKLIVADVVVGSVCLGQPQMGLLPLRTEDKRYDCAVNSTENPTIFVIQVVPAAVPGQGSGPGHNDRIICPAGCSGRLSELRDRVSITAPDCRAARPVRSSVTVRSVH
eukprot:768447-Hanusia_phi.AAC.6